MTPTEKSRTASIYREELAFLENARNALAEPTLSIEELREKYRALIEEYDTLLRKMVKITGISDKTQLKLLNAKIRIQEQQEQLTQKNARLEEENFERTRIDAQLQQRNQELALLNRVGQMFSSTIELDRVLTTVLQEMHEQLDILATSFWLRDPETGELVCKQSIGPGRDNILGWRLPVGQGIVGQAALTGEIILVADTRSEHQHYKEVDLTTGIEIRSIVSIPFRSRGEVIGVLNLVDTKAQRFTQTDLQLVQPIAAAAASAVENARLYMLAQREIAQRARTEEELRQAKDRAEVANQAKSIFLSNMSHELRAPLNAILGFARILNRDPDAEKTSAYAGTILRSGEHLLTLINQVLDLSKIEAGRMALHVQEIDLFQLLDALQEMFALKAQQKGIVLSVTYRADVPRYIRTDEVKLRQILINLLSNAIKFTQYGEVTLNVRSEGFSPPKSAEALTTNLYFSISDTGPGIAPEELDTLFEAFTQTAAGRHAREGTGLGLAISRQFARLMGGDIHVSSQIGRGTTFTLELTVEMLDDSSNARRQTASRKRPVALEPGQPQYRLLIADDKPENRQLLITLLASFEFELREAANGQEALELWHEWQPHLIIMDIRMPELDGYEATARIRDQEAQKGQNPVKIVILSASIVEAERIAILAAGCDGFLYKPFRDEEIFAMLEQHLGVTFVYERERTSQAADDAANKTAAFVSAIAEISPGLLKQLARATESLDIALMLHIIAAIRVEHPSVADRLERLAQNFEYDLILKLISYEQR